VQAARRSGAAQKAASAHVRVIEDGHDTVSEGEAGLTEQLLEGQDSSDGPLPARTPGFHVRPVPIDQPIEEPADE
jgi:hypothetical protein